MFVPEIIIKKKKNLKLTKEEINFIIHGYVEGTIPDYQISALLMAIYFNGMDEEEITNLCDAMMHSGEVIDLSRISGVKVDKHSTGGVGDKTSLVLGPLVASLGGKVAKLSGRGLGHTGGTIDKLESIPGFNVNLTIEQFIKQVNDVGLCIIGQTAQLDPADKKLYALRDVTGTVDSIPLIATSIMSKKLATGTDVICLDVKYGSGAFFEDIKDAKKLAQCMVRLGNNMGKKTKAILSNMDQPLGNAVGNSLEVIEAINTLKGHGPADLKELCVESAAILLVDSNLYKSVEEARIDLEKVIEKGKALDKLAEFVKGQGGDESYIYHPEKFKKAKYKIDVTSPHDGYIESIKTVEIGKISVKLGAGRERKEDPIDHSAGIIVYKKPGDNIKQGEVLASLYTNIEGLESLVYDCINCYTFSDKPTKKIATIEEVIE